MCETSGGGRAAARRPRAKAQRASAAEALEARGARLMAKPDIARGGVIVESDVGSVDARIATRWAQAAGALGSDEPWDEDSNNAEPTR